jgi:hypothetical protein
MGLVTNNCRKHGGYVEDQCPTCVEDAHAKAIAEMEQFFRFGESIELSSGDSISVESLFQHFRVRLLQEIKS